MVRRFLLFMSCVVVIWIIFFSIFAIDKTANPSPYEFTSGEIVAFELSQI